MRTCLLRTSDSLPFPLRRNRTSNRRGLGDIVAGRTHEADAALARLQQKRGAIAGGNKLARYATRQTA